MGGGGRADTHFIRWDPSVDVLVGVDIVRWLLPLEDPLPEAVGPEGATTSAGRGPRTEEGEPLPPDTGPAR